MAKKSVLILDIDNTLNNSDPEVWVQKGLAMGYSRWDTRQWTLYEEVVFDVDLPPHPVPHRNYKLLRSQYDEVAVVTSRLDSFLWRVHTEAWLQKAGFHYDHLLMRPENDTSTPSRELKMKLITPHISGWDVSRSTAIDDDAQVIRLYRTLGFNVFVAPHEWEKAIEMHRERGAAQPVISQSAVVQPVAAAAVRPRGIQLGA